MLWSILNYNLFVEQLLAVKLRQPKILSFLRSLIAPVIQLHDTILYQLQHDGRTIYLEKMLNEHFQIAGYDSQNHHATKKIYIDDVELPDNLFIHQDAESESEFLEDIDSDDDLFIDSQGLGNLPYSWIIFIPNTLVFEDYQVKAQVDKYRYIGKKYNIQTYEL